MKKIILVTLAFIAVSHGQNSNEIKYSPNWFNSISVTPTNIVFVFHHTNSVIITQENESRRSLSNELFYLTPDREIILTVGKHTQYKYTPVLYSDKKYGFQKNDIFLNPYCGFQTNSTYIVLSDVPIKVDEGCVKKIMVNGEWKKYKEESISPLWWFLILIPVNVTVWFVICWKRKNK